jgi:hypothetical protein
MPSTPQASPARRTAGAGRRGSAIPSPRTSMTPRRLAKLPLPRGKTTTPRKMSASVAPSPRKLQEVASSLSSSGGEGIQGTYHTHKNNKYYFINTFVSTADCRLLFLLLFICIYMHAYIVLLIES